MNMESSQAVSKKMRPAAVAGRFFPDQASELRTTVDHFLKSAQQREACNITVMPKALIVPHAGYRYSGAVAASAYIRLLPAAKKISRVVLVGPSHKVRLNGLGFTGADYFDSPLGRIVVDVQTVRQCVSQFAFASINNKAHQYEHSLETQLPFLQRMIGKFDLVPLVVGAADPQQVAQLLSYVWGGDETLIVISSDLSHYKPYAAAQEIDRITSRAITNLDPDPITYEHACGQLGVRGLLFLARKKKLRVSQIDVRNSGDTAERKDQVVGYGSFGFYQPAQRISEACRAILGDIAKQSIRSGLSSGKPLEPQVPAVDPLLTATGATFVTLQSAGSKLRGCVGSLSSRMPLYRNVSHNAFKSAFEDARFKPLNAEELDRITIDISVLGPWQRIDGDTEESIIEQIRPFVDGMIFKSGDRRGTFLPSVWNTIPDRRQFFRQLKRKGGFGEDYWSPEVEVYRYDTESWRV